MAAAAARAAPVETLVAVAPAAALAAALAAAGVAAAAQSRLASECTLARLAARSADNPCVRDHGTRWTGPCAAFL